MYQLCVLPLIVEGHRVGRLGGFTICTNYTFSLPYSPPHLFRQLRYTQVALTQDTDSDAYTSYSHRLVYPPCKRFFIEPKAAASAIKCNITVIDSQRELCRLLVVPFSPKRGKRDIYQWSRGVRNLDRSAKVLSSFLRHCPFCLIPRLLSIQSHSQITVQLVSFPDCCPFSLIPGPLSSL